MKIDNAVHPVLHDAELKSMIGEPWASGATPRMLGARYEPPFNQFVVDEAAAGDRAIFEEELFARRAVDVAIVTPLSRGLIPNPQHAAAVAAATNDWVEDHWLSMTPARGQFVGSIRIPINNVTAAVAEIERRAENARFVQVAIPLRGLLQFGDEYYFPIWQAAAARDLPIAVYDDVSTVVESCETPVGAFRYFADKYAYKPMVCAVHISSLISSGTFNRLPELRFIFGDCGVDFARPMLWRMDKDWRSGRFEVPWVKALPSQYANQHVRFISQPEDGLHDGETVSPELIKVSRSGELSVFGSHFPFWNVIDQPVDDRASVMADNALLAIPRLRDFVTPANLTAPATI